MFQHLQIIKPKYYWISIHIPNVYKCSRQLCIDKALVEAQIHGPTEMDKIKAEKQCKRCFKQC